MARKKSGESIKSEFQVRQEEFAYKWCMKRSVRLIDPLKQKEPQEARRQKRGQKIERLVEHMLPDPSEFLPVNILSKLKRKDPPPKPLAYGEILSPRRNKAFVESIRMNPKFLGTAILQDQIYYLQNVVTKGDSDQRDAARYYLREVGEALIPPHAGRGKRKAWFPASDEKYQLTYAEELYRWGEVARWKRAGDSPESTARAVEEDASTVRGYWGDPKSKKLVSDPAIIAAERVCEIAGLYDQWKRKGAQPLSPRVVLKAIRNAYKPIESS